jgi:hypothetical protein
VEQRQSAQTEQDQPGDGVPQDRQQVGVVGRGQQVQRERDAEQEQEDGDQQGGDHAAAAEQQPEQRLG